MENITGFLLLVFALLLLFILFGGGDIVRAILV